MKFSRLRQTCNRRTNFDHINKMQFLRLATIVMFLTNSWQQIISAPTDTSAPGEHESAESQLVDSTMTQGAAHRSRERKSIDYFQFRHVVADGAQRALDECRQKFKWERWNCPKKTFLSYLDRDEFAVGQSSLPSNKEIAYTGALIASSIAESVVRSCSVGTNSMCSCTNPTSGELLLMPNHQHDNNNSPNNSPIDMIQDQPTAPTEMSLEYRQTYTESAKNSNFAWAGCEEIVKFGFKVAKMYLDSREPQGASRLIEAHNYEAGRQAVKNLMVRKCKCTGPSGSCQTKTCWPVLPDMSEVSEYLKRQYRVAAKVGAVSAKDTDVASLKKELAAISPEKLVFADASPDYCYENKQLGINGTLGRYCSRAKHRSDGTEVSRSEKDSCDRLCTKCGYKIKRERINVEKQCDCRFVYCCSVECKRCPHVEETFKCVRHS